MARTMSTCTPSPILEGRSEGRSSPPSEPRLGTPTASLTVEQAVNTSQRRSVCPLRLTEAGEPARHHRELACRFGRLRSPQDDDLPAIRGDVPVVRRVHAAPVRVESAREEEARPARPDRRPRTEIHRMEPVLLAKENLAAPRCPHRLDTAAAGDLKLLLPDQRAQIDLV